MVTLPETLVLMALASKAALLAEDMENLSPDAPMDPMERLQFIAAAKDVRPILAKVDKENPGMVAIPHDGVAWKDRVD